MKALLCKEWGPPEALVVADVADPAPGAGQVVVRVRAASVNFPDGLIIQNKYQVKPNLPFTPGSECAGVVEQVGEGVKAVKAGDRVIAFPGTGAFAEQVQCPADKLIAIPRGLGFEAASVLVIAYGTSYHALKDRAALQPGETLLVLGASGGVGLAAVEIGKALGARVIAAASSDEKLEVCKAHGADELINYSSQDLREAINALTDGKGVDVVYDPVGGKWTEIALRACAWRGRLLIIGFADGETPRLPANIPLLKGCSIVGVFWGRYASTQPEESRKDLEVLLDWMNRGVIRPFIAQTYPLDRGAEAIAALLARQVSGKVVITPNT